MKKYFTITLLTIFIQLTDLSAQPSASLYFTTAFPINEYRLFDDEPGYGGNLELLLLTPSKQHPLGIGLSFSFFHKGYSGLLIITQGRLF